MLKAVIFDLDGTLLDTAPDFVYVLNTLRRSHGLDALPFDTIRASVSDGARAMVELGFNCKEDDEGFEELRQEFLALYLDHLADNTRLFDGMDEVLSWLESSGIAWGIATNKPSTYTLPLLQKLKLDRRCAATVCPDHVNNRKPHPEPLYLACQQIGCAPEEAIYVGDHHRDILAGINAGMKTVACNFGYIHANDPASGWNADYLIDNARELIPIVESL